METFLSSLEVLYRLARDACVEIEKFQPDIVVGLAHSGWLPVEVTQALWAETRTARFPLSMRTNIGQEKHAMYHARYGTNPPAFCCGECSWGEPGRLGHYLAWVVEQSAWQKTLRRHVAAILPSKPKRIMVVDDVLGGYRSGYATLALLDALYPNAEISMCAGHNDWTDNFVTAWLAEFIPPLAQEIIKLGIDSSKVRHGSPWQETLKPLINGTEDITQDSLDWKLITRGSAAVQAVAQYVPAEVALSAPQWAKDRAIAYALQRLRGEIKDDEVVEPPEFMPVMRLALTDEEYLAARAWRQGGVTRADIADVYGSDREKIKEGLRTVKKESDWQTHGQKPNEIYFPMESFATWINAYFPAETPDHAKPKILVQAFAEFLPGEVWAGAYPMSDRSMDASLFKDILDKGVSHFVDLTTPPEVHRKLSYHSKLLEVSHAAKIKMEMKYFPLPFRAAPSQLQVRHVLKHIARLLKQGKRIYIHAGHNLEGRTPLILACLLIERGVSPRKALAKVNAFWMKTLRFLIRPPLSEEQRRFILDYRQERH